jgi:hypothetical protein
MEGPVMQELKAGLPVLQQPYSEQTAQLVHGHLEAACNKMDMAISNPDPKELKFWQKQKPGTFNLRMLKLVDQYMEWLLPAFPRAEEQHPGAEFANSSSGSTATIPTTTTTTSSSSSFVDNGSSEPTSSSSSSSTAHSSPHHAHAHALEPPVHQECMRMCLRFYRGSLGSALVGGSKEAAAVRPHLVQPGAGEAWSLQKADSEPPVRGSEVVACSSAPQFHLRSLR